MASKKIRIIGGSAAGAKAAGRARRMDERADIAILQNVPDLAMATCAYPYYAQGIVKRRDFLFKTPDYFLKAKNVEALTGVEALEIDRSAKEVLCREVGAGRLFKRSYDKLILATGARPRRLGVEGEGLNGVSALHTLGDSDYFKSVCKGENISKAAVIGGGLVGMEACEALALSGARVTVAEFSDQILPMLDWDLAALVQNHCEQKGVRVRLNVSVERFSGQNGVLKAVHFTDGTQMECGLAIVAAGVAPHAELAEKAGLSIGPTGGIETDAHMRTSDPDIYAAGDCAQKIDRITGEPVLSPMGDLANLEGRVAGENAAAGDRAVFNGVLRTGICKIFDFSAGAAGVSQKQARRLGLDCLASLCAGSDKPFFMNPGSLVSRMTADKKDRTLLGFQCVGTGDVSRQAATAAAAIYGKMSASDAAGLDMPYAPPFSPAIDHFIAAAHVLTNQADHLFSPVSSFEVKKAAGGKNPPFILDVRDPGEYRSIRLGIGETLIPVGDLRQNPDALPRDKNAAIVCYCAVSARAYEASRILLANGYENVRVMEGGIAAWPFEMEKTGARA
ncbi:FAD-dependent pyridine nucleotide-disulfide oxidoreductase [Candidatus Desulfarcum epimagneticum]|uniref:FAD-dependent pyridine nucleotide-disulfide oxidoreductase n=1 Tax=uncultured Desulfobacteraceae bacterium TaxID=218296 RepID=A0A484HIG9_9BACT|nr:FAD-dependent pyridine nucleotide-disulfide oxidoreductase [uncultured Desulfobacteraceae bacterium]